MAARKSGSDAHNNGPVSYLEDVPFKINEKFRCPAKVGLPVGFFLPDSLLLSSEYDFSLERRSVLWGLELANVRAAQARAAEEATGESEAECPCPPEESAPPDDQEPPPPALNPVLAALSHNAILTPLPAPRLGPSSIQPVPPLHCLDLADFEREEDPFDKLELKTLDDKEELKSILQPPAFVPQPEGHPQGQLSRGSSPSPQTKPLPNKANGLEAPKPLPHKANGLVALLDMEGLGARDERPCNIRSLSFPKLSDSENPPLLPVAPLPNGSPHRTQRTEGGPEPGGNSGVPRLVTSSSPGGGLPCGGALLSMTPGERRCVETVVGMGYSYEGVLRAMQRQGQNVEQVLDYLFVHGRLCERGFDSSAVEEGLEMYQCSEEKALQFLQLMSRFGEMGFEREAIKEVLLVHNNDQEKALEDLMSRATAS